MPDYIRWIRDKVGHADIILNFAGGCVRDAEGRILLQKRAGEVEAWGFPGGAIELGESAENAAIREIFEETGLHVRVDDLIGVYSDYYAVYRNGDRAQTIVIAFYCSVIGGELDDANNETDALKFFTPKDIPPLFFPQHTDILSDILANKRGVYR